MGFFPIGAIIVALLFGSAVLAMQLARVLPVHHLNSDTKGVVSVSVAVVGTLSALVLGLLISNASTTFTAKAQSVAKIASDVVSVDRLLTRYGPETQDARTLLRRYVEAKRRDLFPERGGPPANLDDPATLALLEAVQDDVLGLKPTNDTQRFLQAQALQVTGDIIAARWQLSRANAGQTPVQLMVLVIFWFVIIFASFGLFAPINTTCLVAILLCSMGVGSAIRMITELQIPFDGLIRVSGEPFFHALDVIGR
jgi:hypothetical protein